MKALLLAFALVAVACQPGANTKINPGYRISYGNAAAPPGTSRGLASTITYRDYAGPLSKFLLLLLSAPQKPTGHDSVEVGAPVCDGSTCTTTVTTTHTGPTRSEIEGYNAQAETYQSVVAPAILSGEVAAEADLEVSSEKLGGDTSGFRLGLHSTLFSTGHGEAGTVALKVGVAVGTATMHGRTTRRLVGDTAHLHIETKMTDVDSSLFSMPVRLVVVLPDGIVSYAQLELNFLRIFDGAGTGANDTTYHPELTTLGLEMMQATFIRLGVFLQLDGLHTGSSTVGAEAGFAF